MFGFQRLDAYRYAVEFLGYATPLAQRVTRGHAALANQLRRAALSIPLNIAGGSGKPIKQRARRFHAIARGSALESAAIMDALEAVGALSAEELLVARDLLERVVGM